MKSKLIIALLACLFLVGAADADVVILKKGDARKTGYALEIGDQVVFTAPTGAVSILQKADVKQIVTTKELQKEFEEKHKAAADDKALLEIANWARSQGLEDEARSTYQELLKKNPADEQAARALNFVKQGDTWKDPLAEDAEKMLARGFILQNGRWVLDAKQSDKWNLTPEELKQHAAWNNAWNIRSEHYLVHTNMDPKEAMKIVGYLEEIYLQFKEEFGKLQFATIPQPMLVNVFATQNEYNTYVIRRWGAQAKGTTGFFFHFEKSLTTFAQKGLERQLSHEGFHQLMYHCLGVTNFAPTSTWVHEGIARFYECSEWKDGKIVRRGGYDPRGDDIMQKSLAANQYPRLKEFVVKQFDEQKFNRFFEVCYQFSASYVDFLMNYENGKYRQKFFTYFSTVRAKDESIEAFEKAMGTKVDDLQAEWEKWAKERLAKPAEKKAPEKVEEKAPEKAEEPAPAPQG